jgi:hypothetical protein
VSKTALITTLRTTCWANVYFWEDVQPDTMQTIPNECVSRNAIPQFWSIRMSQPYNVSTNVLMACLVTTLIWTQRCVVLTVLMTGSQMIQHGLAYKSAPRHLLTMEIKIQRSVCHCVERSLDYLLMIPIGFVLRSVQLVSLLTTLPGDV